MNPPDDRRELLLARLAEGQSLSATALAAEFGVSPDAIRRDLRALAAEGRCRRVYGGALPLSPASTPIRTRNAEEPSRKAALAAAAVSLLEAGALVFLDSGSTNLALARALPPIGLSVATNCVAIAAALAEREDITLHMIGGLVDPNIGGCIDAEAVMAVQRINIDLCFLGACAVSAAEGVAAFDAADAAFKRALLRCSRRTVVMATAEKLATRAPHRIAPIEAIDTVVIEREAADHAELAAMRPLGVEIRVAA